ncbi:MAG TPA: hypothetical protein VEY71_01490 [Chitinophagales bacterium]|nr:hypothetical protein [Chitinophagales bacterium]
METTTQGTNKGTDKEAANKGATDQSSDKAYKDIKGWNMDNDPENEPTYPMKNYTGDDHQRVHWERPPQQPTTVEILKSNEHPRVPAAFGTTSPPMGLSGQIRRFAFNYSESSYKHWLPLVLADRVNMIEGIIEDIRNGFFPNIIKERGWHAEWKHNKKGVIKTAAMIGTAFFVAYLITSNRNRSKD